MSETAHWFCHNPRCQHHVYLNYASTELLNYDVPSGRDKMDRRTIGRELVICRGAETYFCDTCIGVINILKLR